VNQPQTSSELELFDLPQRSSSFGAWSKTLTQRLKVLLHTLPFHGLRDNDARRDPETRHYDSMSLAMKLFELIADNMGLDNEVDRERASLALKPLLAAMDIAADAQPDDARHFSMIERLLGSLLNDAAGRRAFAEEYTDFSPDGTAARRRIEFRLLTEEFHPAGNERTILRLTPAGINLYLNALERDIEDEQAAAEAIVQSQLDRGKFGEAEQTARDARTRSVEYKDKIRRIIVATRRDVASVDWADGIPKLIDAALTHLRTRLVVEANIIDSVKEKLLHLDSNQAEISHLVRVRELIEACRLSHAELHDQLMGLRNVFLDEQARQSFRIIPIKRMPALESCVLPELLSLPSCQAQSAIDNAFSLFTGVCAPGVFRLIDFVAHSLRPRQDTQPEEIPLEHPDLSSDEEDEENAIPPAAIASAESILSDIKFPMTLSHLLKECEANGVPPLVAEVVTYLAYLGFDWEEDELPYRVTRINAPRFENNEFWGDELLIEPAPDSEEAAQ
jgi:hypothetical protein